MILFFISQTLLVLNSQLISINSVHDLNTCEYIYVSLPFCNHKVIEIFYSGNPILHQCEEGMMMIPDVVPVWTPVVVATWKFPAQVTQLPLILRASQRHSHRVWPLTCRGPTSSHHGRENRRLKRTCVVVNKCLKSVEYLFT